MSVTVTLHVFSGRPDPAWELTDYQAQELADRLAAINKTTLMKPPGVIGGLGYRGFTIEAVREKGLEPEIYIHRGIVDLTRFDLNLETDTSDLEQWLLSTGASEIEDEIEQHVNQELARPSDLSTASGASLTAVPPYNPGKWNNDSNIRLRNNCYNYANDKITNTYAPTRKRQRPNVLFVSQCADVGAAAQRDGLTPVSSASSTPAQGHFVALVIWPGQDYHWYRLDANALWSHKMASDARHG